jgi:hypothetical protein
MNAMNERQSYMLSPSAHSIARIWRACLCIESMYFGPRESLERHIHEGRVDADAPWVIAALNCHHDEEMQQMAADVLIADIKAGFYDDNGDTLPEPI